MKKAIKAAFPHALPVMTGYIFIGSAYGILMKTKGFSLITSLLFSIFTYAGTAQFAAIPYLTASINPISFIIMVMILNSRYIFYSIAMLGKLKDTGKYKPFLIFGLSDETFSLIYSKKPGPGIKREEFYFAISILVYLFWQIGTALGVLLANILNFNTQGLDFVLAALFLVIFIDQTSAKKNLIPSLVGILSSVLAIIIFGKDNFILPGLIIIFIVLSLLRFWRIKCKKIL